jgi:hypothetical protein
MLTKKTRVTKTLRGIRLTTAAITALGTLKKELGRYGNDIIETLILREATALQKRTARGE